MKHSIKRNLFFAVVCLILCVTIVVVNYVLDNTHGKGISNNMITESDYNRSLALMIVSILMAAASVFMISATLFVYMRRKQAEDMELLADLEAQKEAEEEGQTEENATVEESEQDGKC